MNANLSVLWLQVPRLMVSGHHLQQEVLLTRCHLQRRHRGNDCRRDQRPDQSTQRGEMFSPYYIGACTNTKTFAKMCSLMFFLRGDSVTECVAGSVYPHLAGTYKQPGFILQNRWTGCSRLRINWCKDMRLEKLQQMLALKIKFGKWIVKVHIGIEAFEKVVLTQIFGTKKKLNWVIKHRS